MKKDTIKVYWAPFPFSDQEEQWNMAYRPPVPVADNFYSNLKSDPMIVKCPVTRESVRNTFSLNSNIKDEVVLDEGVMSSIYSDTSEGEYYLPLNSKISLLRSRPTSYEGMVNITYNLSWLFLASEPVVMRLGPPVFPVVMPAENSFLAFGKYDAGRWFRAVNLDYHIPIGSKKFLIQENQPLAFMEFETEKNIEFVRFKNTQTIIKLSKEFSDSPRRWGKKMTLEKRYKMAEKSGLINLVMSEIKKNVIES